MRLILITLTLLAPAQIASIQFFLHAASGPCSTALYNAAAETPCNFSSPRHGSAQQRPPPPDIGTIDDFKSLNTF